MNGQMKKYKESLSRTPGPIMPSQIPKVKLDMRGMVKYAKERGFAPIDLTQTEKGRFMTLMVQKIKHEIINFMPAHLVRSLEMPRMLDFTEVGGF